MRRVCFAGLFTLLLCLAGTNPARAATIVAGPRIDLSSNTFVLPIDIIDGLTVESWRFALAYDPLDVQINTACDPFGDPYCGLLTGPITEGDFFASGAPFNLFVPGFVELDPITLAQTGLLFGVTGAFGGALASPSGNGTLAFILFTILGDGSRPITVVDSVVVTAVPEPGTLALVSAGVVLAYARRQRRADRPAA